MAEQTTFPYEFKEITPEEQNEQDNSYKGLRLKSYRVGPNGYWVYEPFKRHAAAIYNMEIRSTDVYVATYPRSGTTLTQELVWLLGNDLDYATAAATPLIYRYPYLDAFMFFDETNVEHNLKMIRGDDTSNDEKLKLILRIMGAPITDKLDGMPASVPRFIKTHLPMSLLSPALLDTAKVVYVARDPRDVAVSCFHHSRLFKLLNFSDNFEKFWGVFYKNKFPLLPFFEHVKEAWNLRHHPNMLFLFYEELTKNMPQTIRRIASFLGKEVNQDQIDGLCDHLSIENFKNNASVNFEDMREHGFLSNGESFIRKGKTGGWRNYFDDDMTRQAELWIKQNLRDTDLRFPHMTIDIENK